MTKPKLIEQQINPPTDFSCQFYLKENIKPDTTDVLVVSFYGDYPDGSLGREHGLFIARKTIDGLMAFEPECIVLDFREMRYSYGNTILKVFQDIAQLMDAGNGENDPDFPVVVVASEKSKNGLLSLLTSANSEETPDWFFEDMDLAVVAATEKGMFWLEN